MYCNSWQNINSLNATPHDIVCETWQVFQQYKCLWYMYHIMWVYHGLYTESGKKSQSDHFNKNYIVFKHLWPFTVNQSHPTCISSSVICRGCSNILAVYFHHAAKRYVLYQNTGDIISKSYNIVQSWRKFVKVHNKIL